MTLVIKLAGKIFIILKFTVLGIFWFLEGFFSDKESNMIFLNFIVGSILIFIFNRIFFS